jgi:holo-[acyl-carrier protein] synthase
VVVGIGVDLVDVDRFARAVSRHGDRFLDRVFLDAERRACASRADRDAALAARFAAKEAGLKALGTGWSGGLAFRHVEVEGGGGQPPVLRLHGPAAERARRLGVGRTHLSLSHDGGMAVALVILESDGPLRPGP